MLKVSRLQLRFVRFLNSAVAFSQISKKMLHVVPLKALADNYMYLIIDKSTKECAVVDPAEPDKVIDAAKKEECKLVSILTTHHHWDHAGGNEKLVQKVDNLTVLGGDKRIGGLTQLISDGDKFKIGNLEGRCIFTPCHTSGHMCYYFDDGEKKCVFTGDTLFLGGCGRFFEGTAQQMYDSLINKLGTLDDDTQVYCGHEYSVVNLSYAVLAEPDNVEARKKLDWASRMDFESNTNPTFSVPSTIGEEKLWNPFMRVNLPSLQQRANTNDPITTMEFLRNEKNHFRLHNH